MEEIEILEEVVGEILEILQKEGYKMKIARILEGRIDGIFNDVTDDDVYEFVWNYADYILPDAFNDTDIDEEEIKERIKEKVMKKIKEEKWLRGLCYDYYGCHVCEYIIFIKNNDEVKEVIKKIIDFDWT